MNLYRYIPFEIFVDIIINHKLTLLSPTLWDDSHEGWLWKLMAQMTEEEKNTFPKTNQLGKLYYNSVFALCWSKKCDYIPMWSVYSYNNRAIMLSTTKEELEKIDNIFLREITYDNDEAVSIETLINMVKAPLSFNPTNIIEPFTVKRTDFGFENECRIFCVDSTQPSDKKSLDVSIPNIHNFIKGIMVHPLAPEWYVDVVKSFCKEFNIPFDGKSTLYNFDL